MSKNKVREHYGKDEHYEFNRLVQDAFHRLELDTTLHFIDKFMPEAGHILDAGGGPGRYTMEMAKRGFSVNHLDLNPGYVGYTKKVMEENGLSKQLIDSVEGDICDLSRFDDNTFDGVLCLGAPLTHVVDPDERKKAVDEFVRVTKPGSYIFCSVVGRLALLQKVLDEFPEEITMDIFKGYIETGDYDGSHGFTCCHIFYADDLKKAFDRQDLEFIDLVGLEGLASSNEKALNKLYENDKEAFEIWWRTHLKLCTHPAVVDTSQHMMIICRKNKEKG